NIQDDPYFSLQNSDSDVLVCKKLSSTDKSHDLLHVTTMLPNLTKLFIFSQKPARKCPAAIANLRELLFRWQQLRSLTIFNLPSGCVGPIALMANLKRLELFDLNLDNLRPLEPLTTVLGQLEHFTIGKCTQLSEPMNAITKN